MKQIMFCGCKNPTQILTMTAAGGTTPPPPPPPPPPNETHTAWFWI